MVGLKVGAVLMDGDVVDVMDGINDGPVDGLMDGIVDGDNNGPVDGLVDGAIVLKTVGD